MGLLILAAQVKPVMGFTVTCMKAFWNRKEVCYFPQGS